MEVKWVYLSSRQDPRDCYGRDGWVEEKKPKREHIPTYKSAFILRNVQHGFTLGEYRCAACGKKIGAHVYAATATICVTNGDKFDCLFHVDCVPYKPRTFVTVFKFDRGFVGREILISRISPTTTSLFKWTIADWKRGQRLLDKSGPDALPSEDEEVKAAPLGEGKTESDYEGRVLEWLGGKPESGQPKQPRELTPEENEIARSIVFDGLKWQEVADKWGYDIRTIARRVKSIESKLGVKLSGKPLE
jgi:hypothetical protein